MKLFDPAGFDFALPPDLIAQSPPFRRGDSRLLVFDRAQNKIEHGQFRGIADLFRPGDILVLNDTRVNPCRLAGRRVPGGGRVDVLLLSRSPANRWRALLRPGRRLRPGVEIDLGRSLTATVAARTEEGDYELEIPAGADLERLLMEAGLAPLPPYIRRDIHDYPEDQKRADIERYQTVFAVRSGSVAAPTAGLHFTQPLLEEIKKRGVEIVYITLDVGWGTFRPLRPADFTRGTLHPERYRISPSAADMINRAVTEARRLWLVGTTVVRTLESAFSGEEIQPGEGETGLFIRPGYRFNLHFNLVTNFHLSGSSLIMLVVALLGEDAVKRIYAEAVKRKYRFYSFGDAMAVI